MKALIVSLTLMVSSLALADEKTEFEGPLGERISKGCEKWAAKKAKEALNSYFDINGWAGGSIGTGSALDAEKNSQFHAQFIRNQCEMMVLEVLEVQGLPFAPWTAK